MTKKTPVYASKDDLIANFEEVAVWAEKNYGPEVPALTRGRPRKGEQRTPMVGKTVKLPTSLWNALKEQAKAQHTTVNSLIVHRLASL